MIDETIVPSDITTRTRTLWNSLPESEQKAIMDRMESSDINNPGAYFTSLVNRRLCKNKPTDEHVEGLDELVFRMFRWAGQWEIEISERGWRGRLAPFALRLGCDQIHRIMDRKNACSPPRSPMEVLPELKKLVHNLESGGQRE